MAADPLSLTYMKILRFLLMTMGAWPNEVLREDGQRRGARKLYLCFIGIMSTTCLTGLFRYAVLKFKTLSFADLGDKIITISLSLMTWYRITLPSYKKYGYLTNNLIKKFHLIHFKDMGYYNYEINHNVHRLSHYFTIIMSIFAFWAMNLFNLAPAYNNYRHGVSSGHRPANYSIQFSIYLMIPGWNIEDHYILTSFINYLLSYVCTSFICVLDMFLSLLAFQIIGHIKTMKFNLYHFPRPKVQTAVEGNSCNTVFNAELFNVQENKVIHSKIIDIVKHHKLIVSFTGDISDFFGPLLGLNYLNQLASCCLLLLECSSGEPDVLARYVPLTIVIFYQLFQFSIIFEVIGSESEKLKDAVYAMPWESMDLANQRAVCILLQRVQTPINVTAMGMTPVGVQTMGKILKTTLSYYAFLQTIND